MNSTIRSIAYRLAQKYKRQIKKKLMKHFKIIRIFIFF